MENQLSVAMESRDIAKLEKLLADDYFDAQEKVKKAMSKTGTIARCKAGVHNFLVVEKEQKLSRESDIITVEGLARFRPSRVDDTMPAEQWIRVRRLWTKKDGQWLLTGQFRQWID